jgi:integrase
MRAPTSVHVRGSKTDGRDRVVPIVTDEQLALLAFVAKHAQGRRDRLFSGLANYTRTMADACREAKIESASANDFRHASGQWLIDLGTPIELVSRLMGHSDTRITERVYAGPLGAAP